MNLKNLAQEIAKWHFSLVEALPNSKFWTSDNGAISWTEWNIVMKFCIHIDIDKMYTQEIAKWHLRLVEFLLRFRFWKKKVRL